MEAITIGKKMQGFLDCECAAAIWQKLSKSKTEDRDGGWRIEKAASTKPRVGESHDENAFS
jgi:hypothetical protein